jgi:demethylmenaquinone methyltransferase/2-methoxy-6-polyprenyl-1,4-benzoquinol methylase
MTLSEPKMTWKMFNRIAKTYDRANRLLSLGQDRLWRNKLVRVLPKFKNGAVLDLGTGTGDVLIALNRAFPDCRLMGVDPAEDMLAIGREKCAQLGIPAPMVLGSALAIPCDSNSQSIVTMAFAIRNVPDVPAALADIFRVLRPGGTVAIMEFSLPSFFLVRWGYLIYFRWVMPLIGGWISGDRSAYVYLNQSVEAFPYGQAFVDLMRDAGFETVTIVPLTLGIASIYMATK